MQLFRKKIVFFLIAIIIIYSTAGFIVVKIMLDRYFSGSDKSIYFSTNLTYDDVSKEFQKMDISFFSGQNELNGAIYFNNDSKGLIVMVHGYGGDMGSYIPQVQFFVQNGWSTLVYNGTGVNDSDGESRINLYQAVVDLRAALQYIEKDEILSVLPLVLIGHSQGGFAVCSVLNYDESAAVKAVVSFAGMNHAGDMVDVFGRQAVGVFYPLLKPFALILNQTDFLLSSTAVSGINSRNIPIILIQGNQDSVVPADRVAITSFSDEITNANVEIILLTDRWNNDHNSIFWSEEAYNYRNYVNETLDSYIIENDINILKDEDLHTWADAIKLDRKKINGINLYLFDQIEIFYNDAIQR